MQPLYLNNGFGADALTQRVFAWETTTDYTNAAVDVVESGMQFTPENMKTFSGTTTKVPAVVTGRNGQRVTVTGLTPGEKYDYRLGNTTTDAKTGTVTQYYSERYHFTTEPNVDKPFTFIQFADSQGDTANYAKYWGNTVSKALATVPDASFIIHTGDMIDAVTSDQWDAFFQAAGTNFSGPAFLPVLGNHEGSAATNESFYKSVFTVNSENGYALNYAYTYGNALILELNSNYTSNADLEKQGDWIRSVVAQKGSGKFIIAAFHKGPFGSTHVNDADVVNIKSKLVPVLEEVGVSLVLQGHDHEYYRSYPIKNGAPNKSANGSVISTVDDGVVFMCSKNSGQKIYSALSESWFYTYWNPNTNGDVSTDVFSAITVDSDTLTVNVYSTGGQLVDSYSILAPSSISIDKTGTQVFPAATIGYGEQTPINAIVTNTCNQPTGALTIAKSGEGAASFTVSTAAVASLAPGSAASFTVAPNTGLAPGTYASTITVSGSNGIKTSFDVRFTVNPAPYGISIDKTGAQAFPSAFAGYGAQMPMAVNVTNVGYQPTGALIIAKSGADAASFTVSAASIASLAAGGTANFTIAPVTGLAAGTYTSTITVSGSNGINASFSVSFTVNPSVAFTTVNRIASGSYHNLFMQSDGAVWAWGYNIYGQIGDGTTTNRSTPVQVSGLTSAASVAAGYYHSLALKSDGTVWAWGYNVYGQLGNDTTTNKSTPVQVGGMTNATVVAAGFYHSAALKSDGTVWDWGSNGYGQLGDGTTTNKSAPVQAKGLTGVANIAAGYYHTIALKSDGTVWEWGNNASGQLGDGTVTNRNAPVQVKNLAGMVAVAAGDSHTAALKADGTVWAWGNNGYGQLGDGTAVNRNTPVQVSGLTGVVAIAACNMTTVALKSDGTVWAWGYNGYGQLGDGTATIRNTPVQVKGFTGASAISAGFYHSEAVKSDGTVWDWGYNVYGQLGNNTVTNSTAPVKVIFPAAPAYGISLSRTGTYAFPAAAVGYTAQTPVTVNVTNTGNTPTGALAIAKSGANAASFTVSAAAVASLAPGSAASFTVAPNTGLATGTYTSTITVSGSAGITASFNVSFTVNTVPTYGISIDKTGTQVFPSGFVGYGSQAPMTVNITNTGNQPTGALTIAKSGADAASFAVSIASIASLATGSAASFTVAPSTGLAAGTYTSTITVSGSAGITASFNVSFTVNPPVSASTANRIASGSYHNVYLKPDGTAWTWGSNSAGQLGDGTVTNRSAPVQLSGLTGVTSVAAGYYHSIALKPDGTVWDWGYNNAGQLGDGTVTNRSTPVQVKGLTNAVSVAAGFYHSAALKSDGTVWDWGYNGYGQLGDNTTAYRYTPVQVSGLTGVSSIAAGYYHTIALKSDGTVWDWGNNASGQLGDGTVTSRSTPVQVKNLNGVVCVAAGDSHTVALKSDGTVWTWGYNGYGQLGDGTATNRSNPVQVSGLTGIIAIAACNMTTVALKSDGTVWAWGYNGYGQLGDGTSTIRYTPVQVKGLTNVTAISAGFYHSEAVKSDGTVWDWGYNGYGQLGNNTVTSCMSPVMVIFPAK